MAAKHKSPKGMWMSKLGLRIASFSIGAAILAITGILAGGEIFNIIPLLIIGPSV